MAQDNARLAPIDPALMVSVRDHVHNALRSAIFTGQLPHNARLSERQLAAQLGVSTTPLKEALRQLEVEGLVRTIPRRGIIVLYGRTWAEEMIMARAALESMIARTAAQRISAEEKAALAHRIEAMSERSTGADPAGLIAANEAFHDEIHTISRCEYLGHLIDRQRFYDSATRKTVHSDPEETARALAEHTAIGRAIIAGDSEAAEAGMRNHVLRSGALYIQLVFRDGQVPNTALVPAPVA